MNKDAFDKLVQDTVKSTADLLIIKGEEYAGSADRLANFKRGSERIGVTPLQVSLIYASKHFDAICTYIRKDAEGQKQILGEPIDGRFDDLINYCMLMKALVVESREEKMKISESELTDKNGSSLSFVDMKEDSSIEFLEDSLTMPNISLRPSLAGLEQRVHDGYGKPEFVNSNTPVRLRNGSLRFSSDVSLENWNWLDDNKNYNDYNDVICYYV